MLVFACKIGSWVLCVDYCWLWFVVCLLDVFVCVFRIAVFGWFEIDLSVVRGCGNGC